MGRIVVSSMVALDGVMGAPERLDGDLVEAVSDLKRRPDGDVLVLASADLVHELVRQELVDEYRLRLAAALAGGGKRLLGEVGEPKALRLVGTETFASGVVVLTYRPAEQDG